MSFLDWFRKAKKSPRDLLSEIVRLPHWARVALCARSARRVQVVFRENYSDVSTRFSDIIDHTISLAEQSAGQGAPAANSGEIIKRAEGVSADSEVMQVFATIAISAAKSAITPSSDSVEPTELCLLKATEFATMAGEPRLVDQIVGDLDRLTRRVNLESWTDETPIGPNSFEQSFSND